MHNMRVNLVAVCSVKRKSKHVYLGHSFSQNDNFLFLNQQNSRREKTFMEECALTCAMLACKVNTLTPSYCTQYISYENKFDVLLPKMNV